VSGRPSGAASRRLALIRAGAARIAWADGQMPVLAAIRERFARERPLAGRRVAACLHVTAETANLVRALAAGGAEVSLCAANPLSTQDDVAAALAAEHGAEVFGVRGEDRAAYERALAQLIDRAPQILIDDGAELIVCAHRDGGDAARALLGATEETATGLVRLRAMEAEQALHCPVLAVNETLTERVFNDRYGTGQSTLDGLLRATNLLLAGRAVVVLGYGSAGRGVAQRAKGAGAAVIVCEVDPVAALEARMEGYEVMSALAAAPRGEVFITVTGAPDVLRREHFELMRDGAVLANAGHFDVEIALRDLAQLAGGPPREVLPLVDEYEIAGRRLHLVAKGRVVNLAAAAGHPGSVMDLSFAAQALAVAGIAAERGELAPGVHPVAASVDAEIARLKLAALGIEIDALSEQQERYLRPFGRIH
jgi:adenosylhomocysteinase